MKELNIYKNRLVTCDLCKDKHNLGSSNKLKGFRVCFRCLKELSSGKQKFYKEFSTEDTLEYIMKKRFNDYEGGGR